MLLVVLACSAAGSAQCAVLKKVPVPADVVPSPAAPASGRQDVASVNPAEALYRSKQHDLYGQSYVVPDWYYQTADGADDAPEIARAQSKGRPVLFECHHYSINSAIAVTTLANWHGCGWQSQPTISVQAAAGTWFDVGSIFIDSASAPITISGNNATGSTIEGIAVDEPGMTKSPVAVTNGNGQIAGWTPATWSPAAYTEVFRLTGAPDVTLRHLLFEGVNAGISATTSGRSRIDDIRGQAFSYLISVQESYDVSRITDVHQWSFWSDADPVMQYQQAHTQAIISNRNDTPFWDRIFAFGVLDGIAVMSNADGSTSGAAIGSVSCDFTQYCIHVYKGAANVNAQVSSLRSYGQKWNTIHGAPVAMLSGSSLVQVDGVAILQIGQANTYGTDKAIFAFTNSTNGSNIHVDSLYGQINQMSPGASIVTFPTTGSTSSLLTINQELLTPPGPAGFTQTNTSPNGLGVGSLQTPVYVTRH